VIPVLTTIAVWWIGTGVVLYLQQRLRINRLPLVVLLCLLSLVSLATLKFAAGGFEPWRSYTALLAAVVLWGCIELSYYSGLILISGIHKRTCPENCSMSKRFRLALGASIWHELSVLFLVLWLMRWSAKLNLFFGAPNFNTDWFPRHMLYVHSYIRRAPVTWFFPASMLVACLTAYQLLTSSDGGSSHMALSTTLPGILLVLAILEHVFMALPIADTALWNRIFAVDETTPAPSAESTASGSVNS